jgi:hypothetical protein
MINESLSAKGIVTFKLVDENGNVKQEETTNLVVNTGKAFITSRMLNTSSPVISHMGVGTGATAAAATDTGLGTALGARQSVTPTNVTTTTTNDAVQYVASFAAGVATGALTEAALFNDVSAGTMICRTVYSVINKGANDTLTITWKITIA